MDKTVWKVVIGYGAGYEVRDENNKQLLFNMNSYWLMQEAFVMAKGKNIKFEYFSEEIGGLEPIKPFDKECID